MIKRYGSWLCSPFTCPHSCSSVPSCHSPSILSSLIHTRHQAFPNTRVYPWTMWRLGLLWPPGAVKNLTFDSPKTSNSLLLTRILTDNSLLIHILYVTYKIYRILTIVKKTTGRKNTSLVLNCIRKTQVSGSVQFKSILFKSQLFFTIPNLPNMLLYLSKGIW